MRSRTSLLLLLAALTILAACGLWPSVIPSPATPVVTDTQAPTPTPTPAAYPPTSVTTPPTGVVPTIATPGIVIRGRVTLRDGSGLAGIPICRSYASYSGEIVATTDLNGDFQSGFAFIPGDEMIGVWPLASGYTFDPPYYGWRHYHGPEQRTLEFVASSSSGTPIPPAPCH